MATSFWEKHEVIAEIEKNKREKVIVAKCERQGKEYMDYRIYVEKDDSYVPTSKGYTLELSKAIELSNIVNNIINN